MFCCIPEPVPEQEENDFIFPVILPIELSDKTLFDQDISFECSIQNITAIGEVYFVCPTNDIINYRTNKSNGIEQPFEAYVTNCDSIRDLFKISGPSNLSKKQIQQPTVYHSVRPSDTIIYPIKNGIIEQISYDKWYLIIHYLPRKYEFPIIQLSTKLGSTTFHVKHGILECSFRN